MARLVRLFADVPSKDNGSPATMRLEVGGANIQLNDPTGLQQFFDLVAYNGIDGEIIGGPCGTNSVAAAGTDPVILFPTTPLEIRPMEKGLIRIGSVTIQIAHTGAYGLRTDSMMAAEIDWRGGQLVLNPAATGQVGLLVQPRSALPIDTHGPCVTTSALTFPSIVGFAAKTQCLVKFDHSSGPIRQNKGFTFTEPNGGATQIVVTHSGHLFEQNYLTVAGAHAATVSCIDIGNGSATGVGGANVIDAILAPEPGCTAIDYWSKDDVILAQIALGDTGAGFRGITLEAGSSGLRATIGRNAATNPIVVGGGSGPNYINGATY